MLKKSDFGSDFQWGVATAAYQIEGASKKDGKGVSIWDTFSNHKRGKYIKDRSNANHSCKHYKLHAEDISILKTLHIPNYRFSISWSRIFPQGNGHINSKGIDFYDRLIDQLLEQNIDPWTTLYHWDLPQSLQNKGGWTNREMLNWFEEYASFCLLKFGDRVKNWMVLNEPMVFTGAGYFMGIHAPGLKGMSNFLPAMHHATLCQAMGGRLARELVPNVKVGTTFSCSHIDPYTSSERDQKTAQRFDALLNRLYIEPSQGMGYPIEDLPVLKGVEKYILHNDENKLAFDFDFIGVQNYTREVAKSAWYVPYIGGKLVGAKDRKVPYTSMGWEVYPKSIYLMLKKFAAYPKIKELIVSENGAAFDDILHEDLINDTQRISYLQDYLQNVRQAQKEGVPVKGYFIWTLMDNFEWAEGYTQPFGLVHVDFKTQKRTIKNSGYWYRDFLRQIDAFQEKEHQRNGVSLMPK